MENYIVSARKYRPSTFASVVGQKALTATLRNSINKDRLAHAYLFCGSRGVGKTSCARIFAKTINCTNRTADGEACNECASCREFNKGNSINIVELDAASNNSVDDIRGLTEQVQVPPINAKYRVFIVDEVHMLSQQAFNAFLKTLEEPPEYVIFILATTEKHKIIPTILSRCQIYDFNRISIQDMIDHLEYVASQEGIGTDKAALNIIAHKADGAMRDALSIFDQVAASSMGNITYESTIENLNILDARYYDRLVEAFLSENVTEALLIYKEIRDRGFDSQFFINGLASHFRDLMVAREPATMTLLEEADDVKEHMAAVAKKCSPTFLYQAMDLCNTADLNYRVASNKQFLVELTLIKLCQLLSPSHKSDAREGQLRPIKTADNASHQPSVAQPTAPTPQSVATASPRVNTTPKPTVAPPIPVTPHTRSTTLHTPNVFNKKAVKQEEENKKTASLPKRSTPFSDAQFMEAWKKVMELHPKEQILCNAMRISNPKRIEATKFGATVESEVIRDSLLQATPVIVPQLRDLLENDYVDFTVTLNKGQASVSSLTDAEFLQHLRKAHPYLNIVIDDLKLKIM